jgi:hypothetical protein
MTRTTVMAAYAILREAFEGCFDKIKARIGP